MYVFNAASIVQPNAIEQLTAELIGYDIDVAVISESHLKKKHASSCVEINGYALFRCERPGCKVRSVLSMSDRRWMPRSGSFPSLIRTL